MIPAMFPGALLETEIPAGLVSSAGVFDSQGVLVRVLWSAVVDHPDRNDPQNAWDGTIDDFESTTTVAPTGDYTIKVLSHSCTYTWEGVVGNTSPNHDNSELYWSQNSPIWDMEAAPDGRIWFAAGYHERKATYGCFNPATPQVNEFSNARGQWGPSTGVSVDGTIAYFALNNPPESLVYGINVTTHAIVAFSSGTSYLGNTGAAIAFDNTNTPPGASWILSVAVQRTGNFLFITRNTANKLLTVNKTTGAVLQTNTSFVDPRSVKVNPVNDDLWLVHRVAGVFRITKCAVDGSGNVTLTATQTTHTFAGIPTSISISPDGATLLATDTGTHQIVAFNTSNATLKTAFGTSGLFGTAGGYAASPDVTNTKWMFAQGTVSYPGNAGLVTYANDGSLWVGDGGNCRILHFTSGNSPTFIEQSMYQPLHYAAQVCRGDPTRVFCGVREFAVNYGLPLSPTNGSWTLVKNWGQAILNSTMNLEPFTQMKYLGTYSNGRTYSANGAPGSGANAKWFEHTATGMRDTGVLLDPNAYVDDDMNVYYIDYTGVGSAGQIFQNAFTGFDGLHNPTWALAPPSIGTLFLTTETIPPWMCQFGAQFNGALAPQHPAVSTVNNIIPLQDHNGVTGFVGAVPTFRTHHMGGVDALTGKFMWAGYPAHGEQAYIAGQDWLLYPEKPYYAPGWLNSGGLLLFDSSLPHIFYNHIGEGGWGNNQINIWAHYHDSGLMLERFGVPLPLFAAASLTNPDALNDNSPQAFWFYKGMPGAAGNSRWGGHALVDGVFYLYQSDEWYHSGIHRWKVENLDSLQIASTPVSWNSGSYVAPTPDPNFPLDGLPFDISNVPDGSGGWTRVPAADAAGITLRTNVIKCEPREPPDLTFSVTLSMGGGDAYVVKDLPRVGSGNWSVTGKIYLQVGWDDVPEETYMSFQILDNTDKVIFDIHAYTVGLAGATGFVAINDVPIRTLTSDAFVTGRTRLLSVIQREVPFSCVANVGAGTMTVSYDGISESRTVLEVGASLVNVAKVRLWHKIITVAGSPPVNGASLTELEYSEP